MIKTSYKSLYNLLLKTRVESFINVCMHKETLIRTGVEL